jgi:hypothetical protein
MELFSQDCSCHHKPANAQPIHTGQPQALGYKQLMGACFAAEFLKQQHAE